MKNKFKKLLCLVAVVVIVLASFIVPASAAESSDIPLYINFLDNSYSGFYQIGNNGFTVDSAGYYTHSLSDDQTYLFMSNKTTLDIDSSWYCFEFSYTVPSNSHLPDIYFMFRYNGKEGRLCSITDNTFYLNKKNFTPIEIYHNGSSTYLYDDSGINLPVGTSHNIRFMINKDTKVAWFSVDNSPWFGYYMNHLTTTTGNVNRFAFFQTELNDSQIGSRFQINSFKMYEVLYTRISDIDIYYQGYTQLFEAFFLNDIDASYYNKGYADGKGAGYTEGQTAGDAAGYERGYGEGQTAGYNSGYNKGQTDGYTSGYQAGKDDGYNNGVGVKDEYWYDKGVTDGYIEGKNEYYNELYEKGLESIDENEGTLIQGFLSGMWNGVQNFMQELLDGITFSGLSLRSIVSTFFAILLAAFVIKVVKG